MLMEGNELSRLESLLFALAVIHALDAQGKVRQEEYLYHDEAITYVRIRLTADTPNLLRLQKSLYRLRDIALIQFLHE